MSKTFKIMIKHARYQACIVCVCVSVQPTNEIGQHSLTFATTKNFWPGTGSSQRWMADIKTITFP